MVKTRIDGSGVSETRGRGLQISAETEVFPADHRGMTPYQMNVTSLTDPTSSLDASQAGIITISGSGLQVNMPAVADVAGSMFVFRSVSPDAHFLTGSSDDAGVLVFNNVISGTNGSNLAFPATTGASISLVCDGTKFLVLGFSGSFAVSGT